MNTHDGPYGYFWHPIRVRRGTPFHHVAHSNEVDGDFRRSDRTHIFHVFGRGIAAGKWKTVDRTEEEALLSALEAHVFNEMNPEEVRLARAVIARNAIDIDDEWLINDALGTM